MWDGRVHGGMREPTICALMCEANGNCWVGWLLSYGEGFVPSISKLKEQAVTDTGTLNRLVN